MSTPTILRSSPSVFVVAIVQRSNWTGGPQTATAIRSTRPDEHVRLAGHSLTKLSFVPTALAETPRS
jgi:hypothetical protein